MWFTAAVLSSMALVPVQVRLAGASCSPAPSIQHPCLGHGNGSQAVRQPTCTPHPAGRTCQQHRLHRVVQHRCHGVHGRGAAVGVGVLAGQLVGHRGPGEGGVRHVCGGEGVFVGAVVCVGPIV